MINLVCYQPLLRKPGPALIKQGDPRSQEVWRGRSCANALPANVLGSKIFRTTLQIRIGYTQYWLSDRKPLNAFASFTLAQFFPQLSRKRKDNKLVHVRTFTISRSKKAQGCDKSS